MRLREIEHLVQGHLKLYRPDSRIRQLAVSLKYLLIAINATFYHSASKVESF